MKMPCTFLLPLLLLSHVVLADGVSRETIDVVGEYEGDSFGAKAFFQPNPSELSRSDSPAITTDRIGFFIGGKFPAHAPNGKEYNWTQSRAENFYKSEFRGYSDRVVYGLNGGVSYLTFADHFYMYGGLGITNCREYREYYDDTFTRWSNDYYIKDGMNEEYLLDAILGANLLIERVIVGAGYSFALSNTVISLGYRLS